MNQVKIDAAPSVPDRPRCLCGITLNPTFEPNEKSPKSYTITVATRVVERILYAC